VAGTKSPLTGTYLDSFFGGHFAPATKYAGYDGIIIRGRAEELCYVSIEDDTVVIKSAAAMRGLGTIAAAEAVKKDLEDFDYTVSTIGKAGENGVPYSLIGCEYNRQAGRGGAGAVMGSKNLKAVAVKGSNLVHVHNQEKFARAVLTARKELAESGDVKALANSGMAMAVEFANEVAVLPTKNYKYATYEHASQLGDAGQERHLWIKSSACMGCPIAYEVGGEPWQGQQLDPNGVEGKGESVCRLQNLQAGTDTLTKCDFGGFGISTQTYCDLLEAATGIRLKPHDFDLLGERIWNITRLFNLREGIDSADDTLPKRFVEEALPDGPAKGHRISGEDMSFMLKEYYQARGWSESGIPTEATVRRLGLQ